MRPRAAIPCRSSVRRWLATLLAVISILVVSTLPAGTSAHPADRLLQHAMITVSGDGVTVDIAISGGLLAVKGLAHRIDTDGDGLFAPAEAQAWLTEFLGQVRVTQDGRAVTPNPDGVSLSLPDPTRFQLGLAPLTIRFSLPVVADGATTTRADILVTNTYLLDMTDFRVDVFVGPGGAMLGAVTPGKTMRLLVEIDPTVAGGGAPVAAAERWSASGVVARADELLHRERTPQLVIAMLAIFVVMGGLHALQPGHGKTLVAAWLVATGGTPRDAVTLAGIVTVTHTLSVFVLGGASLAASQWFLPSRVIPALGIVSGLLVAGMGAQMLWRSTARWRHAGRPAGSSHHHHDHDHHHEGDHAHDHPHAHTHDSLDDVDHARAHAMELDRVYVLANGRRRVAMRQLIALGISGGIAPCPDALAILLLAIGIGEAAFGMVAIVAFSLGLSVVLVAFGLGVALAGPAWRRARASASDGRRSRMDRIASPLSRLAVVSPILSALIVLALGIGFLWKALAI